MDTDSVHQNYADFTTRLTRDTLNFMDTFIIIMEGYLKTKTNPKISPKTMKKFI